MTEGRRLRSRLAALAAVVLGVHLWLLAGTPPKVQPDPVPATWTARTVAAPAPLAVPDPALRRAGWSQPASRADAPPVQASRPASPAPSLRRVAATAPAAVSEAVPPSAPPPVPPSEPREAREAPTAFALPPPARWHYEVTAHARGMTLRGEAELQWRHDGREYEAQLQVRSPLLRSRTQQSTGRVTPQGLAPLRFSDKARSEEAAHFARDSGTISFSSNRPNAPLQAGAQDRLSVMLQLAAMFAGDASRFPPGTAITLQTASTREAEQWVFMVEGTEQLVLPAGTVEAVKLLRAPRREYDVKVELWLAPGAAYAPVRLRLTQPNGDWVDQQWSSTDRG